jgi:hypothetical protein
VRAVAQHDDVTGLRTADDAQEQRRRQCGGHSRPAVHAAAIGA